MSSLKDFEEIKLLGKGAFAQVYQVKRKCDGNIYAMKKVKFAAMSQKERDNALNEIRILASVQHANIIGYMESFYDDDTKTLNIVMDFANEGDLDSKIKKHIQNRTNFPENEVWSYLIQILSGLKSLHKAKIMHRDLKCANIFVKDGILKLGDLNVSKLIKGGMHHTQTGTPYYASPEVWSNKPYDYKSDIWSVGCIIYELCALKPPFRAQGLEELFKVVTRGKFDPIPRTYSADLQQIIAIMLQVNPSLRPDVDRLLKNPYIICRMDYSKVDIGNKEGMDMLNTIKVPRNLKDVNKILPEKKNYGGIGDVIIERKNSEENVRPTLMEKRPSDKNNIAKNYLNNPSVNPQPNYKINPSNNPSHIVKPNPIQNNPSNNYINRDMNRIQQERENLLNKYRSNDNKARPKTPDIQPNRNVYEIKKNPLPSSNQSKVPYKPSNHIDNPYIIKK